MNLVTNIDETRMEYEKLLQLDSMYFLSDKTARLILYKSALQNLALNRYHDILAKEGTRVQLQERQPNANYINANHIDIDEQNHFIAAQAPLPTTIADFYNMVWDQNTGVIIMLTKEVENSRNKANCYWPENLHESLSYCVPASARQPETDSDLLFRVTKIAEINLDFLIIRSLEVERKELFILNSSTEDFDPNTHADVNNSRIIYQLQYINWGDFKVPKNMFEIDELIKQEEILTVVSKNKGLTGPNIYHCSAGIGRTGTYISCLLAKRQCKLEKEVNVYDIVAEIKKFRPGSVQVYDQYYFIYKYLQHCYNVYTRLNNRSSLTQSLDC